MPLKLEVKDIVETKKNHPCGSKQWEILRTGADFRIRCLGCDRQVWIDRPSLEKSIKKVIKSNDKKDPEN